MKVIDLHCDTLLKLNREGNLKNAKGMVTLDRLKKGQVAIQCFADFVPTGIFPKGIKTIASRRMFQTLYKRYLAMMERYPDELLPILTSEDISRAEREQKIGVLLTIEDGGVIEDKLENVKKFYDMGVRLITLTWNHPNFIGYPNSSDPHLMKLGLTDFGRSAVEEMERLGIIVDISHVSDGVFYDVAEIARKPFIASHSNSRTICGHPRNMSDEMIRILAEKGGIMGLNLCPAFLKENSRESRVEEMVSHILHIRNTGGSEVLALGSDFDGINGNLEIRGPQDWDLLYDALKKKGLTERELEQMWYKNARRVFTQLLG